LFLSAQEKPGGNWLAFYTQGSMQSPTLRLSDLQSLLAAVNALRHGRALGLLAGTLSFSGLFLASVESALAGEHLVQAASWAVAAGLVLFYGSNAAGWMLMQSALGQDRTLDASDAIAFALRRAHRVLGVLLMALWPLLVPALLVTAGLWAVHLPWVGAPLLALLAPLAVVLFGASALMLLVLVGPLAGPSVWFGLGIMEAARGLRIQARERLVEATLLQLALLGLVGGVGGVLSLTLLVGARTLAFLAWMVGLPVPPQQVVAHLFGYTLKALGSAGAQVVTNAPAMALSVGGGLLVGLAVVLPTAVYLRGCCANFLSLRQR
jgi:hypothetical protein